MEYIILPSVNTWYRYTDGIITTAINHVISNAKQNTPAIVELPAKAFIIGGII